MYTDQQRCGDHVLARAGASCAPGICPGAPGCSASAAMVTVTYYSWGAYDQAVAHHLNQFYPTSITVDWHPCHSRTTLPLLIGYTTMVLYGPLTKPPQKNHLIMSIITKINYYRNITLNISTCGIVLGVRFVLMTFLIIMMMTGTRCWLLNFSRWY